MKNKLVWIVVIILILFSISLKIFVKEEQFVDKPLDINVGDEFSIFESKNIKYVLNYVIGDATGDGINDMVILIGEKEVVEGTTAENVDVVLYDSSTNQYLKIELKKFDGSDFRIELADFTSEEVADIMIIAQNEGEYITRIITYKDNNLIEILKDKDNKGLYFSTELIDGFKVKVSNRKLNVNNILELEKDFCIKEKFFEASGKLIKQNEKAKTTGYINIELVQLSDAMGIKTTQRIILKDKLNIIDEITAIWKYQDGKWQLKEASGLKQGNLLY